YSFPSGHVGASTAFFGVLLIARRRVGLACLPIPILIGFSRMYIGAHYLSDVICAAVLGSVCALIVASLMLRGPSAAIRRLQTYFQPRQVGRSPGSRELQTVPAPHICGCSDQTSLFARSEISNRKSKFGGGGVLKMSTITQCLRCGAVYEGKGNCPNCNSTPPSSPVSGGPT